MGTERVKADKGGRKKPRLVTETDRVRARAILDAVEAAISDPETTRTAINTIAYELAAMREELLSCAMVRFAREHARNE